MLKKAESNCIDPDFPQTCQCCRKVSAIGGHSWCHVCRRWTCYDCAKVHFLFREAAGHYGCRVRLCPDCLALDGETYLTQIRAVADVADQEVMRLVAEWRERVPQREDSHVDD
jgi:hypothetical protein